nr:O-acetyltransferase family protein [Tanacetum cinerariifolium]
VKIVIIICGALCISKVITHTHSLSLSRTIFIPKTYICQKRWYDLILNVVAAAAVVVKAELVEEEIGGQVRLREWCERTRCTKDWRGLDGKSSDIILVELENRMVKEDYRVDLLEGGVLQATSPASHSSSITTPVVMLFTMDESFLLENL